MEIAVARYFYVDKRIYRISLFILYLIRIEERFLFCCDSRQCRTGFEHRRCTIHCTAADLVCRYGGRGEGRGSGSPLRDEYRQVTHVGVGWVVCVGGGGVPGWGGRGGGVGNNSRPRENRHRKISPTRLPQDKRKTK